MKRYLTYTLLLLSTTLFGQQCSLTSQIHRNKLYVNPAFAGIYETVVVNAMHRSPWAEFSKGEIYAQNLEINAPLTNQSIALGIQVRNEKNFEHVYQFNRLTCQCTTTLKYQANMLSTLHACSQSFLYGIVVVAVVVTVDSN